MQICTKPDSREIRRRSGRHNTKVQQMDSAPTSQSTSPQLGQRELRFHPAARTGLINLPMTLLRLTRQAMYAGTTLLTDTRMARHSSPPNTSAAMWSAKQAAV